MSGDAVHVTAPGLATAPSSVRIASAALAILVSGTVVFRGVTRLGATAMVRRRATSRSSKPANWTQRLYRTIDQVRAAAPPPSSAPLAAIVWTVSWISVALVWYATIHLAAWIALMACVVIARAFGAAKSSGLAKLASELTRADGEAIGGVSAAPAVDSSSTTGGSALASALGTLMGKVGPKTSATIASMAAEAPAPAVMSMLTSALQVVSSEGLIGKAFFAVGGLATDIFSEAVLATKRGTGTCVRWTLRLSPIYVAAIATSVGRRAYSSRGVGSISGHPIDPIVCAEQA